MLQRPASDKLSTKDHYEGIRVNLTCASNYKLVGDAMSTCHSGNWTPVLGTCKQGR